MSNTSTPGQPGGFLPSFFRAHQREKMLFAYRGAMDESIMEAILGISEHTLEEHTSLAAANRKVSFLLVECFQNILRHGAVAPNSNDATNPLFSFRTFDDSFYINSCNTIEEVDRERLTEIVDLVNGLDKEGLTELYRNRLSQNAISERGGAGLGLIELSRKSGQPIRYRFDSTSDGRTLFFNQVSFRKPGEPDFDTEDAAAELFARMTLENIVLLYKGDMSQRSILPLLSVAEVNTASRTQTDTMRRVGHVLIEMLQNISRHSDATNGRREGIIAIARCGNAFNVVAGNFVNHLQMQKLQGQLDEIAAAGPAGLKELHRAKFKATLQREDRYSSGLGLVQIARDAEGRMHASFTPEADGRIFFALGVLV